MIRVTKFKAMVTALISSVLSAGAATTSDATVKDTPDTSLLRQDGAPSEAAVQAIMDKWRLTRSQTEEGWQEARTRVAPEFASFPPEFIQASPKHQLLKQKHKSR